MIRLKTLYDEYSRYKNPAIPDHARSYPNYFNQSTTTNGLTKCIIAYILLFGGDATRISSAGRYLIGKKTVENIGGAQREIGSNKFIPSTTRRGSPDIQATINGLSVKIEVKNEKTKDRMSEVQRMEQEFTEQSGGIYFIARNLSDTIDWIENRFEMAHPRVDVYNRIINDKRIKL